MDRQPRILSIKEINKYIRMKLENDAVLSDIWLRGEISNFTHHSSGHMYFTLKDKDSRIKCVMFASHNARLPFIPREGAKVLARGNVSVYERDGSYQFYVQAMQPDGIGSLYLAYEQLKRKLEEEGLFDAARKRAIPAFPKAIGVITSPTGAAVRDIMTTLQRRYPLASVYVYPVLVQGTGAAASIAQALEAMNRHGVCDVLIVGRGGGSLEELWAFNEEVVARAIAGSAIPVISAVGHETDYTIADFAADLRAATPTAAAELAVPHIAELAGRLDRQRQRLRSEMLSALNRRMTRLERARRSPFFRFPRKYLLEQAQRLDRASEQLRLRAQRLTDRERSRLERLCSGLAAQHPGHKIAIEAKRLQGSRRQLEAAAKTAVKDGRQRMLSAVRQLDALSPLKVMARGYSLVYDREGKRLVKSVRDAAEGDRIGVRLSDGYLECLVQARKGEQSDGT